MKLLRHLAPLALGLAALGTAHANLLQNGGFELPGTPDYIELAGSGNTYVTNWVTILSGAEYFRPASITGLGSAIEGRMVVDVANYDQNNGGIAQTFATTAGQQYRLDFIAGNSRYGFGYNTGDGTINVQVGSLTTSVATPTALTPAIVWQPISLTFTALAGPNSTLSFSNLQDARMHYAFIDNVRVTAVPEPQTWALLFAGLGIVGTVARRRRTSAD